MIQQRGLCWSLPALAQGGEWDLCTRWQREVEPRGGMSSQWLLMRRNFLKWYWDSWWILSKVHVWEILEEVAWTSSINTYSNCSGMFWISGYLLNSSWPLTISTSLSCGRPLTRPSCWKHCSLAQKLDEFGCLPPLPGHGTWKGSRWVKIYIRIQYIPVVPGQAGGGSFQSIKKNINL